MTHMRRYTVMTIAGSHTIQINYGAYQVGLCHFFANERGNAVQLTGAALEPQQRTRHVQSGKEPTQSLATLVQRGHGGLTGLLVYGTQSLPPAWISK